MNTDNQKIWGYGMHDEATRAIEDFESVAARYCTLVEGVSQLSRDDFLKEMHILLPLLVSHAACLPSVPTVEEDVSTEMRPVIPVIEAINKTLGEAHSHHLYHLVFDPWDKNEREPVASLLAMDLAEIYTDIREGFDTLRSTGQLSEAVWEWKFSFDSHWGHHATHALVAIHSLRTDW